MSDHNPELTSEEEEIVDNLLEISKGDMDLLLKAIQLHTVTVDGEEHVDIDGVHKTVTNRMNDAEFDSSIQGAIESVTKNWA